MLFCQWSYFHLSNDALSKWKCKFTVVIITRETHVSTWRKKPENQFLFNLKMMMMMMMMMNCFCERVCRRKAFKPYFQPSSLSKILTIQTSSTPQAGFEPGQNLSSDFAEWSCAVVITTTSWRHVTTTPQRHWHSHVRKGIKFRDFRNFWSFSRNFLSTKTTKSRN